MERDSKKVNKKFTLKIKLIQKRKNLTFTPVFTPWKLL